MRKAYVIAAAVALALFHLLFPTAQPSARQLSQPPPATTKQAKRQKTQQPQSTTPRPPVAPPVARPTNAPPPYYDYPLGSATTKYQALTVDEAVTLALANASLYQQAVLEERIAREDVKQARAAFFPQLSLPLTYTGTTPSKIRFPDEPPTFSFVSASAINETTALVNVSGTLDIAGRLRAALSRSRALLEAASAGTQVARRELVLATVDAYYALLLTRQTRRLGEETLALAEGFVTVAEGLKSRGEGEEGEVFRARAAAATQRSTLEEARAAEFAAMNLLRTLTGVDLSTQIITARLVENVPSAIDFNNYTEDVIRSRPELAQIDAQQRAARADARAARRELLPDLTYSLNGGFDAGDFRPVGRYAGGSAIISLNIPIFNFGASRSRETQARLRAQQLEIQRELVLRQLRQEFYVNRANALASLQRITLMREASEASQQNMTSVFMRYRLKKATIIDVIDAQTNYAETRTAYYQAIVDYYTSRVRLEEDPSRIMRAPQTVGVVQPRTTDAAKCALGLAEAPSAGGLRLGMSVEQATTLIPSLKLSPPDATGVSEAILSENDFRGNPFFEGAQNLQLEFLEGRLFFIRVSYPATGKWNSKDEFLSVMSRKLNIQGDWKPFFDWEDKNVRNAEDLRDLALECRGFRLSVGIGLEGLGEDQFPHFDLEDMNAARVVREREEKNRLKEKDTP